MKRKKYINSATLFGLGYLKYAPGTMASLLPLLFLLLEGYLFYVATIFINLTLVLKSYSEINMIESESKIDPSFVVVDEFHGMSLIILMPFIPKSVFWIFLSFVIFRFFDIVKPFPINLFNSKKGAFYVFADDVVAALLSIIVVYLTYTSTQILAIILL